MIEYMSLEEQVDADFSRARRRAFFRRLMDRLRIGPVSDGLPSFEDLRKKQSPRWGCPAGAKWP